MEDKNKSELQAMDPNAKTVDLIEITILHYCAGYAWVEGVKYLMSLEPNLTIADRNGGNKVSQFVESVPNL